MNPLSVLRCKHFIATHTRAIAAVCAVAVVLGGSIAFTGLLTGPVVGTALADDPDARSVHGASVGQSVGVEVLDDTTAFEAGQSLDDRPLYPLANATDPVVTASADAQDASLEGLAINLTYEATADAADGSVYAETETLDATTPDGPEADAEATVPVADVLETRADLEEEFGPGVDVSVRVESVAEYRYELEGGTFQASTVTAGGELEPVGNMYALPHGSERETRTVGGDQPANGPAAGVFNAVAVLAVLTGGAGLASVGALSRRVDPDALARQIQERRFSEWVTVVESYTPQGNVNVVEVPSLADLVNLAIDTRRRVLYHRAVNEYVVVDGNTLFTYTSEEGEEVGATGFFGMEPSEVGPIPPPPGRGERDESFGGDD